MIWLGGCPVTEIGKLKKTRRDIELSQRDATTVTDREGHEAEVPREKRIVAGRKVLSGGSGGVGVERETRAGTGKGIERRTGAKAASRPELGTIMTQSVSWMATVEVVEAGVGAEAVVGFQEESLDHLEQWFHPRRN